LPVLSTDAVTIGGINQFSQNHQSQLFFLWLQWQFGTGIGKPEQHRCVMHPGIDLCAAPGLTCIGIPLFGFYGSVDGPWGHEPRPRRINKSQLGFFLG